uniref:E3 ubiquitin-protein ligase TRIM39-like n=1 Tax=Erpetoichthys calabaricus TaxID=27687 RepID=A0A8C4T375_ERPCA
MELLQEQEKADGSVWKEDGKKMTAPAIVCAQQLTCPVCLDIFTSPISTPCGHSFCMEPDLNINRTLAEITEEFKQTRVMYSDLCFKHTLVEPVSCLEDTLCTQHSRPLELFCMTDQTYICLLCGVKEHKIHNTVHIEVEWRYLVPQQQMAQLKQKAPASSNLLRATESELDKQMKFILERSDLSADAKDKLYTEILQRYLTFVNKGDKETGTTVTRSSLFFSEYMHLTLDPHTASPSLTLSADGKEVCYGDAEQEIPDNPLRFDIFFSVLSKEGFTSGRHYWEVKVGEKTDWILGVVRESINRKGDIELCPQNGYWTVSLCYGSGYWAFTSPSTFLALNIKPRKVGVFLDYEEGQLSFFNVESQTHLYTFIDIFTEKLYPYFSPYLPVLTPDLFVHKHKNINYTAFATDLSIF